MGRPRLVSCEGEVMRIAVTGATGPTAVTGATGPTGPPEVAEGGATGPTGNDPAEEIVEAAVSSSTQDPWIWIVAIAALVGIGWLMWSRRRSRRTGSPPSDDEPTIPRDDPSATSRDCVRWCGSSDNGNSRSGLRAMSRRFSQTTLSN